MLTNGPEKRPPIRNQRGQLIMFCLGIELGAAHPKTGELYTSPHGTPKRCGGCGATVWVLKKHLDQCAAIKFIGKREVGFICSRCVWKWFPPPDQIIGHEDQRIKNLLDPNSTRPQV